ncbi:MAG: hypothetical protein J1E80_08045 [Desulfovibrionaceae bacterium]|nr:hypothetical protein [Desulfovibrionaceae bacterium]
MSEENRSLRDSFTGASLFNQLDFIIERKIREIVNTSALVRVDSCTSSGPDGPAGTVSATPLVSQVDAEGNALPMVPIPRMPHFRLQAGIAALVLDPVPGDIGIANFLKSDSSGIGPDSTEPQRPASWRFFDTADGVLAMSVSNKAPKVWIHLKQDETITIHAPQGFTIETDQGVDIQAPTVTMSGNLEVAGNITAAGEMSGKGIVLSTHTHGGVEAGLGNTGAPNASGGN